MDRVLCCHVQIKLCLSSRPRQVLGPRFYSLPLFTAVRAAPLAAAPVTHQSDEQEEHEERPPQHRLAEHVSVSDRGHGDDQEVDARPVAQLLGIFELDRVSRILQLLKSDVLSE